MSKRKLKKQIKRLKRRLKLERAHYAHTVKHYEKFHKCDMICRITDIEPIETPLFSTAPKTVSSPPFIFHDWTQTDEEARTHGIQAPVTEGAQERSPEADGIGGGASGRRHDGPHPA